MFILYENNVFEDVIPIIENIFDFLVVVKEVKKKLP